MRPASPHSLHALRGNTGQAIAADLRPWLDSRLLLAEEVALAARIAALDGPPSTPLVLAFALALRADRLGSALVDLAEVDVQQLLADRENAAEPPETTASPTLPAPWPDWQAALAARPALVWSVADTAPGALTSLTAPAPFVLAGSRLYTARAWSAESRVANGVLRMVNTSGAPAPATVGSATAPPPASSSAGWSAVESAVLALIQGDGAERQRQAASSAVSPARLQIVTGGPGTGKTYTVRAMLTLAWLHRALATGATPTLDVQLAAPTGKAAQRMKEAMAAGLDTWCTDVNKAAHGALRTVFPDPAALEFALHTFLANLAARTLHRLLGYQHFNPTRFRHDRHNPLSADLIVVDEASMVDLTMMAHLFDAVGDSARLVLVGDRRQLASVETGTVLADLCAWGSSPDRPLVELNVSRRFPATSPVGRFATASEALDAIEPSPGDPADSASDASPSRAAAEVADILAAASKQNASADKVTVRWLDTESTSDAQSTGTSAEVQPRPGIGEELDGELNAVAEHWVQVMRALDACVFRVGEAGACELVEGTEAWRGLVERSKDGDEKTVPTPAEVLARVSEKVRVLAAHRKGNRGVTGLNREIWRRIAEKMRALPDGQRPAGVLRKAAGDPGVGKPIIVTKNDYSVGRFNGDVGLWVRVRRTDDSAEKPALMALFPREGGGVAAHTPSRLPEHEVVWAMTVHKSQGSEFDKVVFVLPDRSTALWTRELVYTGITRVKRELVLVGTRDMLIAGLARRIRRASGLQQRLG